MTETENIPFAERVYKVVERIPYGRVTTYGSIARALGSPKAGRMVGYALNTLQGGHDLPAHRVINRIGFLSGGWHFGHPDIMKSRLEAEGVVVSEAYVVNLKAFYWDPASDPEIDKFLVPNY